MSRKKTRTGAVSIPSGEASSRIKDRTRHPDEDVRGLGHCPETRAEADRLAAIAAEYGQDFLGRYNLRDVKIGELVRAIEKGVPDAKLAAVLRSCVTEPLAAILAQFGEADGELAKLREAQVRGMYRDHVVDKGQQNMRALLAAFAKNIADLKALVHEFAGIRDLLHGIHADASHACRRAAELVGELQTGAQELSGFIAERQRTLESGGFADAASCTHALAALGAKRSVFDRAFAEYCAVRDRHEDLVRQLAGAHDLVRDAERREARLASAIRNREEFFREAGMDPFTLIGEEGREISAAREIRECRDFLTRPLPELTLFSERGIGARADDLSARIDRERERLAPPPAPLRAVALPAHPEVPAAAVPAVPLELAVCVFAAFCKERSPRSGRTSRTVYDKVLVPQGATGGCGFEAFHEGILTAERQGLMERFEMRSRRVANLCFRPTAEDFRTAALWAGHFPPDFAERVRAGVAALHERQRKFWTDIKAKQRKA